MRTGCGNPSHSKAAPHAQRSFWSRSLPGSGCTQSAPGATFGPWLSPPGAGRNSASNKNEVLKERPGSAEEIAAVLHGIIDVETLPTAADETPY